MIYVMIRFFVDQMKPAKRLLENYDILFAIDDYPENAEGYSALGILTFIPILPKIKLNNKNNS